MKKQHVQYYRKILLRKMLLDHVADGAYYVPFIGDGDIAHELYKDKQIYGADIDANRVKKAQSRLPKASIKIGDCNTWLFPECTATFALADVDAYSNPYIALKQFWNNTKKTNRIIVFITDGLKLPLQRAGNCHGVKTKNRFETMSLLNFYVLKVAIPKIKQIIGTEYVIKNYRFYLRSFMLYLGAIIEHK